MLLGHWENRRSQGLKALVFTEVLRGGDLVAVGDLKFLPPPKSRRKAKKSTYRASDEVTEEPGPVRNLRTRQPSDVETNNYDALIGPGSPDEGSDEDSDVYKESDKEEEDEDEESDTHSTTKERPTTKGIPTTEGRPTTKGRPTTEGRPTTKGRPTTETDGTSATKKWRPRVSTVLWAPGNERIYDSKKHLFPITALVRSGPASGRF
ncbi:hypothetical protein DENSPDRAFT_886697 [Dentipellis sp. KUC8613]|nr:hypothetical protein DENSPDRAFT_886697 [Dentipellis sp. KUC8613]